jgi:hypothetical protein
MVGEATLSIQEALHLKGYAVARGLFSSTEIAWMRGEVEALIAANARPLNGGLCSGPLDADNTRLARALLNDSRLASPFGGDLPSQIHVHSDTYNNWHVDFEPLGRKTPTRIAPVSGASPWIYKIAIFLQDHPERDGLSVVPGSHQEEKAWCAPLHVNTRAGDIVIFNHRLRHAGRLPKFAERAVEKFSDSLFQIGAVDYAGRQGLQRKFRCLQQWMQPRRVDIRLAIFLFFGAHAEIGQKYASLSVDPRDTARCFLRCHDMHRDT